MTEISMVHIIGTSRKRAEQICDIKAILRLKAKILQLLKKMSFNFLSSYFAEFFKSAIGVSW